MRNAGASRQEARKGALREVPFTVRVALPEWNRVWPSCLLDCEAGPAQHRAVARCVGDPPLAVDPSAKLGERSASMQEAESEADGLRREEVATAHVADSVEPTGRIAQVEEQA